MFWFLDFYLPQKYPNCIFKMYFLLFSFYISICSLQNYFFIVFRLFCCMRKSLALTKTTPRRLKSNWRIRVTPMCIPQGRFPILILTKSPLLRTTPTLRSEMKSFSSRTSKQGIFSYLSCLRAWKREFLMKIRENGKLKPRQKSFFSFFACIDKTNEKSTIFWCVTFNQKPWKIITLWIFERTKKCKHHIFQFALYEI